MSTSFNFIVLDQFLGIFFAIISYCWLQWKHTNTNMNPHLVSGANISRSRMENTDIMVKKTKTHISPATLSKVGSIKVTTVAKENSVAIAMELAADLTN